VLIQVQQESSLDVGISYADSDTCWGADTCRSRQVFVHGVVVIGSGSLAGQSTPLITYYEGCIDTLLLKEYEVQL